MAISETDIKRLWGRAAGRCSRPGCGDDCLPFLDVSQPTIIGEMAHIIAKKESGPRAVSGGGNDTYANLILLCPTDHTLVDKAPDGEFTVETLLEWKSNHERAVEKSFDSPSFLHRSDLGTYIKGLLVENRICWKTYGPESDEAKRNPNSTAGNIWQYRKLSAVVPNNRRIINAVRSHKSLFDMKEYEIVASFMEHAEGFELNSVEPKEGVPTFPVAFGELFGG